MSNFHKSIANSLFLSYSYFSNSLNSILNFLPPFLRIIFFKIILKKIGKNCLIDYKTYFRYPNKISIGNFVSVNRGCEFYPSYLIDDGYITIGNNVVISPNVKIYAIAHDYSALSLIDYAAPVVVEDDVWICGNSIILPGVTIGRGSVIGAGSIVNKNIPPFSIAVGTPAKPIKIRKISSLKVINNP